MSTSTTQRSGKMITVLQTVNFLSGKPLKTPKYLGCYFSVESAREKLGFYFVEKCCAVVKF